MDIQFSNNGHSTLAASISSSDTSVTVASGHGSRFPSLTGSQYFYATLIDSSNNLEIVKVTARSSDVLTITRAQESTTARAYAIGDRIELRATAAGFNAIYTEAVADATPGADTIVNSMIATDAVNADSIAANAVGASELNVSGNGTSGQALLSDGDGTFSWGTAGGVLQVVQNISTTRTALNTYTDTALMSQAITPSSSSSKVMVEINLAVGDTDDWGFMLKRNGTVINNHGYSSSYSDSNSFASGDQFDMGQYEHYNLSWKFLDSPATTGAVTYVVYWNPTGGNSGTLYFNRDSNGSGQGTSMLTLTELSGDIA